MATLQDVLNHANYLLNNGQADEAMSIYDEIVRRYPQLGVGWFYKAYCRQNSDPIAAVGFYANAVIYDKNCAHHVANNLHVLLRQNDSDPEVDNAILDCCKRILSTHPDLWEIRYEAACIIGNLGNHLEALSEFYRVINDPNSHLTTDIEAFCDEYGLDTDIKNTQAYVRYETLVASTNIEVPLAGQMFEYCYYLPVETFYPYQKYYFDFGQYIGFSITEVVQSNPHYIDWCIHNVPSFCVNEVVCHDIMSKGFGNQETLMLNTAKLQYLHKMHPIIGIINQSDYPDIDLSDTDNLNNLLNR